jgi:hypothetical protein
MQPQSNNRTIQNCKTNGLENLAHKQRKKQKVILKVFCIEYYDPGICGLSLVTSDTALFDHSQPNLSLLFYLSLTAV